jgi:hypothetical protein
MGNLTKKHNDYETLRNQVDGKDPLFDSVSVHGGGAAGHNERVRNPPEWAMNDGQVGTILLRAFPKWKTNQTQYNRSLRWLYIIRRYFRLGESALSIAIGLSHTARSPEQVAEDWDANPKRSRINVVTVKQVTDALGRMSRVAQGLRANGEPRFGKPGRPKSS